MPLSRFHPVIQQWFLSRFEGPTAAQAQGWPAIAQGRHTLICAPTGSGKTLAAFLTCIDSLLRSGIQQGLPDATQVVYVSPLKALSNDIQKNLAVPLREIASLAGELGIRVPEMRAAVRTGDTPSKDRQRMAKKPPHILITTPESLYILLTSRSGREGLKSARTLILDEIHAVADDKRGSHLSLSVERLCALADGPVTRIGLSATQRPITEMARFLVGNENVGANGVPDCLIVDSGHARKIDLDLNLPQRALGPIATHELWGETLDAVARLVQQHGTTLVFVNTRRLVERVAHQLAARLGEEAVAAHHGSLSRSIRLAAEEKLRGGQVKVCVATASLELGIDIGLVDLVCQIGSPRSIGLLLQRTGRSGHTVGGTPKGRLFPLTRDELVECAALMRAVRRGNLDTLLVPPWPLDVLAQQIVAACVPEEWAEEDLFDLCRRAYPYRDLPRERFDQVVRSLSQGFAPRLGRAGALLHRDGINRRLKARRGASMAAMTNGGAISDTADYDVIADPDETFVGTVNEDFAIESLAGDVFLLGNTPWKIRRVERGRVRVENAQGLSPTVPFWLGEAPGRTRELSQEVTELRDGMDQRLDRPHDAEAWLTSEAGVNGEASRQLVDYLAEGRRVLGMVPTGRRVVAERFFDESGGTQLVIHAPFGSRVTRAWGMALRKQICRTFDFELQASATDDGLNLSLGPQLSFPLEDIFNYLSPRNAEPVLRQAVLQAPLFGTRWRWNATRSLAVLRHTGGRKVPPPLLRMRADDLLAAVFPAQVQCQDNAPPGELEVPDHPLVFETMRDCLTGAMDLDGLKEVLASIKNGDIEVYARDTVQPSVFAHQILNAMPYAFLDDAPLEERRARAVSLRRALPEDSRDLGALDPAAIEQETENAWPRIRDPSELYDALMVLGILPERVVHSGIRGLAAEEAEEWFNQLLQAGRAYRLRRPDGWSAWVAAERLADARAAYPEALLQPGPRAGPAPAPAHALNREDAVLSIVRGWVECSGPFTCNELACTLGLTKPEVKLAMIQLETEGMVLRGRFRPGVAEEEFCERRILARVHRSTIGGLRRQVEPVPPATFVRFLFQWQHAEPAARLQGEPGLLEVIGGLQGFEMAAGSLESEVLPARVADYNHLLLDRLCMGGEVVWGRLAHRENGNSLPGRGALTRNTPIGLMLRESLDWVLDQPPSGDGDLPGAQGEVLAFLARRGASFLSDMVAATRRLASDVEEALWLLAAHGRVTSDSLEGVRGRINGSPNRRRRSPRMRRRSGRRQAGYSRWSLLEAITPAPDAVEPRARQFLRRYGFLFPEVLAREPLSPAWRDLVRVLRRLEARGEIRGGRFVSGFTGEQFALPEAIGMLRGMKNQAPTGNSVVISACDPLNLAGILTPGERVPAVPGNRLVFMDGVPVCSLEGGLLLNRSGADEAALAQAHALILLPPGQRSD